MSLRARLTLWYTVVFGGTLIILGLLLYYFLAAYMIGETDRALNNKATQVLASIKIVDYPFLLKEVVLPDVDVFASPDTFLQVVDNRGRVQARSGNLGNRVLPLSKETLALARRQQAGFFETLAISGSKVRLYNLPLYVENNFIGIMQVGRSLAQVEATLSSLRVLLIISILIALAAAATVGLLLARAALRPIEKISKTAAEIDSGRHLSRRIDYRGPRDEIGRLVATLNAMFARLEQAYRRLEDTYSAQKRFVADASHELRSPLTTIGGNVELLQKMAAAGEKPDVEVLEDMREETRRMTRLVEDMLALARADVGLQLEKENLPLQPILAEVARTAQRRSGTKDFAARGLGEAKDINVFANKDYLKRAVYILLDNAFKYTADDGWVRLGVTKKDERVGIWIKDNGQGIKEEDLPHIFERFYRGDTARGPGGSGLGLSIAKWIVDEHAGEITVESAWGAGSTFTIWLPVQHDLEA